MWIPCPRTNTPRENVETPSAFQTSFLEASLAEFMSIFFFPTFLFNFFFCIVYVTQTPQIAHEQYRVRATTSYSYEYENEHMVIVQVHECEYHCCCTRTSFGGNHQHIPTSFGYEHHTSAVQLTKCSENIN